MKTLSFNTTGVGTQFALNIDGKGYYLERGFSKHSETFFPLLDEFLNGHKTSLKEIDCFGAVVGPGSFTGIRIGLSVLKMFAYAEGKPCVAVNSLAVLAYNIFKQKRDCKMVCAVINAGADNLYYQLFESDGSVLREKFEPRICSCPQFKKLLADKLKSAEILYYDNNETKYACDFLSAYKTELTAEGLDLSVQAEIKEKKWVEYKKVLPLYIRGSQVDSIAVKSGDEVVIVQSDGNEKDIEDISILENSTDADDLPWNKHSIEESFKNPSYKCWIMRSAGKAVGYVSVMDLGDEYEILRIVVHSKARMQGVGQKLLAYLIENAGENDAESIVLEVNQFNFPALMLYEKLGFEVVGRREKYYHRGQDAFIMRKKITG